MDNLERLYTIMKYLFLGFLQGVTEPIPISSSGHVQLAQHLLDIKIDGFSFLLLVNSASLIAVIIIYRNDITRLIKDTFAYVFLKNKAKKRAFLFTRYLIVGTIPAGLLGFLFADYISEQLSNNIKIIGITLLITGGALWIIKDYRGRKQDGDITLKDALIVGLAQAVALVPGISRSGATIVAAIALKMKSETALRFSFLLYIPVSVGGMVLSFNNILTDDNLRTLAIPYTIAFITSLIATYFALKLFMNIMAKGNLKYFSYYCFIAGSLVILFL